MWNTFIPHPAWIFFDLSSVLGHLQGIVTTLF